MLDNHNQIFEKWIADGLTIEQVRERLNDMGYHDHILNNYVHEFKKLKYGKRQNKGSVLMGIGAFLGLVSCVFTLTNPIPELYNLVLYGLTSIAALVIFLGFYFVFE